MAADFTRTKAFLKSTDNLLTRGNMMSLRRLPEKAWKLKQSLVVILGIVSGLACNPAPMPTSDTVPYAQSSNSDQEEAQTKGRKPNFEVKMSVSSPKPVTGFSLQISLSFIEYSVKDCASGYSVTGLGDAQHTIKLYRFDQSCKIYLDSFIFEGESFAPMPGQTFDPALLAETQFLGDADRVLTVKVTQQLPLILDTLDAGASFMILEKSRGQDFNIDVYSVGLESSATVLVESPTTTLPITVRRGVPAQGTLTVGLQLSGTATPGVDLTSIPNEVEFQDGESQITIYLRALPDDPFDDQETLTVTILPGPYFIAVESLNLTIRDQSYRPPVWTQTSGTQNLLDDDPLQFTVTANDPDGDPLYYSIDVARTTCTIGWTTSISISSTGLVQGVPGDAAIGSCLLALVATSLGGIITQDVTINVGDRPESPVWTVLPPTLRIFEDENLDVTFTAMDPDPGAIVSYSIDPASSCLGYAWNPTPTIGSSTGRLQGNPAPAAVGRCVITVRAQSQGDIISTDFQLEIARRTIVWSAPSGVPTSTCVPIALLLSDGIDQYIDATTTTAISLVVNNGSGTFYSQNNCSTGSAITLVSWPVGADEIPLYFRSTTANQNLTLVATGGTYEPGYFNMAVGAAASKLLVAGPTSIGVNQCIKYRVDQANSSNVKVVHTSNRTISFTLGTGMKAYNDSVCTDEITSTVIPAYQTGKDFYVQGTSTGNRNVRGNSSGLTAGQMTVQVVLSRTWWNSAWARRLWIQLDNYDQSTAFTNQPVLIVLTPERFNYSLARSDGADLRFVNSSDSTVLPHQVEEWVPGGTSRIWVRVDQIPASSALGTIKLYFGHATATPLENPTTLWADYAGIWHLNESPIAAIPQFKDSTSNARHARAMASPQSLQGPIGNSLGFLGTLDHIELTGFDLAPILGRTATFSAWVKTAQSGSTIGWSSPALTGVEANGTTNDIQYGWLDNTGRIGVMAGDSGSAKSNFIINDNSWRHITITRNESTGAVAFYINGVLNSTGTSESGFKSTPFNRFGLLWDTSGAHKNFNGSIDEIRMQTGLMSAARIRADYKYMSDTHVNYLLIEDY